MRCMIGNPDQINSNKSCIEICNRCILESGFFLINSNKSCIEILIWILHVYHLFRINSNKSCIEMAFEQLVKEGITDKQ